MVEVLQVFRISVLLASFGAALAAIIISNNGASTTSDILFVFAFSALFIVMIWWLYAFWWKKTFTQTIAAAFRRKSSTNVSEQAQEKDKTSSKGDGIKPSILAAPIVPSEVQKDPPATKKHNTKSMHPTQKKTHTHHQYV